MRKIDWLILHCSAGPINQSVKNIQGYWRSIGWKTDGYHFIIEANGNVINLVPIEKPSNGVRGHNYNSINICTIGGVEIIKGINDKGKPVNVIGKPLDTRTPEQIAAQIKILKELKKKFPHAEICGHRDFSPDKNRDGIIKPNEWLKACPSYSAMWWAASVGLQ